MSERKLSAGQNNERLVERRRRRRRRGIVFFIILLLFLFVSAVYGLQQNAVRISHIQIFSGNPAVSEIANQAMRGNYFGIIPRDSIFFFPESRIRADLLAAYPSIAAVSITRNDFSSISIKTDERVPVARWCSDADCYLFDAKGFIFSVATTSSKTVNNFALYEPLPQQNSPIGIILPNAEKFPAVFDLARRLSTFGSPVSKIIIRDDEADDYLASGTRVTYVLGSEEISFTALMSTRANFNLLDGSVEYVDLRFDGKVYFKRNSR